MKNAMTILLTLVLFCATAFADGDMGSGGYNCTVDPVTQEEVCTDPEGDMGSGGRTNGASSSEESGVIDAIIDFVGELIDPS